MRDSSGCIIGAVELKTYGLAYPDGPAVKLPGIKLVDSEDLGTAVEGLPTFDHLADTVASSERPRARRALRLIRP